MKLGETGDYPKGKLDEYDEGGLAISNYKGCVRLDFGKPVTWLALPPDMAMEFAELIMEHAKGLRGDKQ